MATAPAPPVGRAAPSGYSAMSAATTSATLSSPGGRVAAHLHASSSATVLPRHAADTSATWASARPPSSLSTRVESPFEWSAGHSLAASTQPTRWRATAALSRSASAAVRPMLTASSLSSQQLMRRCPSPSTYLPGGTPAAASSSLCSTKSSGRYTSSARIPTACSGAARGTRGAGGTLNPKPLDPGPASGAGAGEPTRA
mmetsp:Transcript_307/g.1010  ORF Transcript_307/g.1010 Transcript_307/m.1010 type:complete len:200 (-) Transcript_307:2418-3017(-)